MNFWYIPSRVGAQILVLFLALLVEFVVFGSDYSVTNAFLGPFFFASLLPVWRRDIAFKVRIGALAAGAIVAVFFGVAYLALLRTLDWPNAASILIGLSTIAGAWVGWFSSSRIIRRVTTTSRA